MTTMKTLARFAIVLFLFGTLVACLTTGSTPTVVPTAVPAATTAAPATIAPSPTPSATPAAPSSTVSAATAVSAAGGKVPSSCDAIVSVVGAYIPGGVATTRSLGSLQHLSCEFANANATTIIIVNIGVGGTQAAFDALRATSGQGGRTVTPVSGLGVSAFSVSKGKVPAGVAALTADGLIYDVTANLTIDQDVALIKQLMALA